jgi:hypothetical protein
METTRTFAIVLRPNFALIWAEAPVGTELAIVEVNIRKLVQPLKSESDRKSPLFQKHLHDQSFLTTPPVPRMLWTI